MEKIQGNGKRAALVAAMVFVVPGSALAFNSSTHIAITRSAITYLATEVNESGLGEGARAWTRGLRDEGSAIADVLMRATVDADYRPEVYLSGWFHAPFSGAKSGPNSSNFTRMFHFLNATVPGTVWDHDGYAYKHGTRQGFDGYLGLPGVVIRGDLSRPLGGANLEHPVHGIEPGSYRLGFKGSDADWKRMFLSKRSVTKAVFPPADVPAQVAYDAMLSSERATVTTIESWNDSDTLATGIFSNTKLARHYWRGEIRGLPRGLDLLGLSFHMAQDVAVPQHASGTADNCHQELEDLADRLTCNVGHSIDPKPYDDGTYTNDGLDCQSLYDPALVEKIRSSVPEFDRSGHFSVREQIFAVARIAAEWKWGEPEDSIDFMGTVLPDGRRFTADRCSELMGIDAVRTQIKFQFNLAVAATAALYLRAATEYEALAAPPSYSLLDLFK